MTDEPQPDRADEEAPPTEGDDVLEAQEGKGYGGDEGERDHSLADGGSLDTP